MTEDVTMARPRVRDLGLSVGRLPPGAHNSITDVAGVLVGHTTLFDGTGALHPGLGPVRTGVTVILPHEGNLFRHKVHAAVHTINGFGKVYGFEAVRELGVIEAPIALTNTFNVGLVADALVQWVIRQNPDVGISTSSANVVVGETNDSYLNDLQGRHVHPEHVWAAMENASAGQVAEGAVGAGTGTCCFGWKGGIGTSSRVVPKDAGGYTVGTLVQSNFGRSEDLMVCGTPVGLFVHPPAARQVMQDDSSIMVVLATDAPLTARELQRLCVRAAAGLARTGSTYDHSSGDFVIAFSTVECCQHEATSLTTTRTVLADEAKVIAWLFRGVVESVEEAILNSMFRAETVVGRDGHVLYGLPVEEVLAIVRRGQPPDCKV
jgi:D-aminopeptidase